MAVLRVGVSNGWRVRCSDRRRRTDGVTHDRPPRPRRDRRAGRDRHRPPGRKILVRVDGAGATHELLVAGENSLAGDALHVDERVFDVLAVGSELQADRDVVDTFSDAVRDLLRQQ